nr:hypothetical protein HK105_002469 [Polyrhizophydium stewartii]
MLLRAELRGLPSEQVECLWAEAFACEWQGDLRRLPRIESYGDVFLGIRSRLMLERVRRWRLADEWMLLRVAVHNGWASAAHADDVEDLALAAAELGAVPLLRGLVCVRGAVRPSNALAVAAARGGRRDVVEFLHERLGGDVRVDQLMEAAATSGSIELVAWLIKIHGDVLATLGAASPLHQAVVAAANFGHLHLLVFLHERFPDCFKGLDEESFWYVSDLRVMRWLHERGLVRVPQLMLERAVRLGGLESVQWISATFGLRIEQQMLETACSLNRTSLVRWILRQPRISANDSCIDSAVDGCFVGVLAVLIEYDRSLLETIVERVAIRGDVDLIEWLDVRHAGSISQRALEAAAAYGNVDAVGFILANVEGVDWDISSVMMQTSHRDVIDKLSRFEIRRLMPSED